MKLNKKLIEEYCYHGEGFKPFLIQDNWQIAKLNYKFGNSFENINEIEVHHKTDEVFILLKGTAVLIGVEKGGGKLSFYLVKMNKGIVYNIPKGVWHSIAMNEDAEVLIVEDANTHLGDYELHEMSDEQKETLKSDLALCIFDK